jgi:hypothetical protein
MLVVPVTQETEMGKSLESTSSRPAWQHTVANKTVYTSSIYSIYIYFTKSVHIDN